MTGEEMQTLKISRTDDIQRVIEKAKRKFGKDKEFAFAIWPDDSLRLVIKGGNYEKTQKGTGEED